MSEVLINLDDDALAAAAKHLGTTGKEETVNTALREFDQRRRRLEAFDELVAMAESGMFDELLDKTERGTHRSASPIDLLVAATAEAHGLSLLHYDHDFVRVAEVTGQQVRWLADPGSID